jgi:hypothetical protein
MSSHAFLPDFQKQSAAASAATIDKYEIASGEMPRRTHKFADPSPVRRNICAIGRRDVGWYSTIPYALAKSQAHRATNLALFNIRTDLHRSGTSPLEFPPKSIYHRRHENFHHHCPRSSRARFRHLRFQRIPAFPSDAAAPARCCR